MRCCFCPPSPALDWSYLRLLRAGHPRAFNDSASKTGLRLLPLDFCLLRNGCQSLQLLSYMYHGYEAASALLLVDLFQADFDKLAKNERLIWQVATHELPQSTCIDMSTERGRMPGQLLANSCVQRFRPRETHLCSMQHIRSCPCLFAAPGPSCGGPRSPKRLECVILAQGESFSGRN